MNIYQYLYIFCVRGSVLFQTTCFIPVKNKSIWPISTFLLRLYQCSHGLTIRPSLAASNTNKQSFSVAAPVVLRPCGLHFFIRLIFLFLWCDSQPCGWKNPLFLVWGASLSLPRCILDVSVECEVVCSSDCWKGGWPVLSPYQSSCEVSLDFLLKVG